MIDEGADGWIAIDGPTSENAASLPAWARDGLSRRSEIRIGEEGIALVSKKESALARWSDVFGVASLPPSRDSHEGRAYVLVPRRAPRPPWFEVTPEALPADMRADGLEALVRAVRERSAQWGYRAVRVERPRMTPHELYQRLLAEEAIPGAVEVPIGQGPGTRESIPSKVFSTVVAGGGGAFAGGYGGTVAGAILADAIGASAILGGLTVGAAVGAAAALAVMLKPRKKAKGRVLALAPDGCVVGLADRVQPLAWSDVSRFVDGHAPETRRPALVVLGADGSVIARVDEGWFSRPLELIVAVAEAYRKRATSGR